jgi:SAM-dependent methyltransferase
VIPAPTPSPNIWRSPGLYETLNRAADPDGLVLAALDDLLAGTQVDTLLDVGCGTGFHLPGLAARAGRVIGVEPHPALVAAARRRVAARRLTDRVEVRAGLAERLPLTDAEADVVYSHWAYFFGPGCEAGLTEVERVLRPGGLQVVVDLDSSAPHGYARWFGDAGPSVRGDRSARFFGEAGFAERRLPVVWTFDSRRDLADILHIEFPPHVAARALRETVGTTIAVPTILRWRRR